jgi:hypothetical protein
MQQMWRSRLAPTATRKQSNRRAPRYLGDISGRHSCLSFYFHESGDDIGHADVGCVFDF